MLTVAPPTALEHEQLRGAVAERDAQLAERDAKNRALTKLVHEQRERIKALEKNLRTLTK